MANVELDKNYSYVFLTISEQEKSKLSILFDSDYLQNTSIYLVFNSSQLPPGGDISSTFQLHHQLKGFIDMNVDSGFYYPIFTEISSGRYISENDKKMLSVKSSLEERVKNLKGNLELVKEIHSRMVPKREIKVKGIHIKSKFLSGENSGGEFFDFLSRMEKLHLF